MRRLIGIARALMLEPDILLCDEATSALDPETIHSILGLIKEISRKLGLTVILITHEMLVISEICDRDAVLEMGRLAELGSIWRCSGGPVTRRVAAARRPVPASELQGEILERRLATLRDLTSKVEILGYVAVPEND